MNSQELEITALSHDGRGIGFLNPSGASRGKAVMVSGALPGQIVSCEILKNHDRYSEGKVLRIVRQAYDLGQPLCPHFKICGACQLQLMPYAAQLAWKAKLAKESLARIGGIERDLLEEVWREPHPSPLREAYRNKIEFAFGFDSSGLPALGFRAAASHEVFPVSSCAAAGKETAEAAEILYKLALDSGLPFYNGKNGGYWRFLILRETETKQGKAWKAICITSSGGVSEREKTREAGRLLLEKAPFIRTFIHEERKKADFLKQGEKRVCVIDKNGKSQPDAAIISKNLLNQEFLLDCAGFFQINDQGADILAQTIIQLDDSDGPMLDIYCGCGAPGILLAKRHSSCAAMEIDKKAADFARKNALNAGLKNYRVMAGDAGQSLKKLPKQDWSLALLDPPRSGLDKNSITRLLEHRPFNIIYVSCNPVTLARDARILSSHYQPAVITGVDLFPHTPHLECVSLWKRRPVD